MSNHNPHLCAKVARVMGKRFLGNECWVLSDTEDGFSRLFSPDTHAADAWEVLEWCLNNHNSECVEELMYACVHPGANYKLILCDAAAEIET